MKKLEFEIAKAKAEMYAEMWVENRVFLFAVNRKEESFPMDFELHWDTDNPDVHIMDSLGELMFRGGEIETAQCCFWFRYYNAEMYVQRPEMISFCAPAEDGICSFEQEQAINDIIEFTITKTINKSEWNGECAKDALDARIKEQGMMNEVNDLIN